MCSRGRRWELWYFAWIGESRGVNSEREEEEWSENSNQFSCSGNQLWSAMEVAASRLGWTCLYRDTKMREGGKASLRGSGNGGAVKMGPKSYFLMRRIELKQVQEGTPLEPIIPQISVR